jgi:hypothetical protein
MGQETSRKAEGPSSEAIRPEAIERLQAGVAPAFALLAGTQLEVFTHLAGGPRGAVTAELRRGRPCSST